MSTDKIKLVYASAEDMAAAFQKGAEQIERTSQDMQGIAATLEGGALLGRGGTEFVQAIKGQLVPALGRLAAKFHELDKDVKFAIAEMRKQDARGARGFK
jgi:uncharacterized protein YukE